MSGERPCCERLSRGFSLPELIFFIVVVGVGLAGVLTVLNVTASRSADPFPVKQAFAIAEALLEEIALKDYANPSGGFSGAATQANRQNFDDVDDYNGYSSTGIYPVAGASPLAGLGSYNVTSVAVSPTVLNGVAAKLITVTITAPSGQAYSLSAYRTNF